MNMRLKATKTYIGMAAGASLLLLLAINLMLFGEHGDLFSRHAALLGVLDLIEAELKEDEMLLSDLDKEVRETRASLDRAISRNSVNVDGEYDEAFGEWVGRVKLLESFIKENPAQRIPELKRLEAEDWLEALAGNPMRTKADVLRASADLRVAAKVNVLTEIQNAIHAYLAVTGGKHPARISELLPFVETPEVREALLSRYEVAGENANRLYDGLTLAGQNFVIWERPKVVDDTYFSQFGFGENHAVSWQNTYDYFADVIEEAAEQHVADRSRPPVNVGDIAPYLTENLRSPQNYIRIEKIFNDRAVRLDLNGGG